MHDLNWAQTDFMEQSQAFAEKIFADVRLLSQSPAPLTGVTRTSYSPEEGRVLKYLSDVCCGLGLQVETDPAGNVWGTLRGSDPELPAVVSGSHCDSVPDGGNYDGLAGIGGALHCTVDAVSGFFTQAGLSRCNHARRRGRSPRFTRYVGTTH